jgi:hypothetical protein
LISNVGKRKRRKVESAAKETGDANHGEQPMVMDGAARSRKDEEVEVISAVSPQRRFDELERQLERVNDQQEDVRRTEPVSGTTGLRARPTTIRLTTCSRRKLSGQATEPNFYSFS